ncbi:tape measure protein [Acinetobacter schindleri]|uniref:Tape measure protein n=1 Tax=Acinetobacter schindleri TaxID=108981 RepID=A0AAE6WUX7_9GAMM|nr:tape measure protein [Acinetobacter schindleri]QIC67490.1 tape measure protein [Acinetobacter schindleri]
MSGKNLTFKLIMEGDNKGLVASAKQSEQVVSKVFETIKQEASRVRTSTNTATQGIDQLGKESVAVAGEVKKLDAELGQANVELSKLDSVATEATKGIKGLKTGYTALASAMATIGVGLGIRELAQAADSYTSLSTRINIATREGGDFTSVMAGVHQVALMTNSSLQATGDLFTRLNNVSKDMGMTQQQALKLTKTVTQAIQIGGGSAQASEAAITQFIQAMQGGVLRGEEFNSIMENGFGLAEALAKGLRVTTGELRGMAEAGELSAERVVKAISSQSYTIQETYNQFPTTVSNALQKISTSWEILIGKMDQANGASATVAEWLSVLADNISVVETLLNDVGEGFVWAGDQLKKIDPQTIVALKEALTTAYESLKDLGATTGDTFEITLDVLNTALGAIFNFNSGLEEAESNTSGFTKALQALNVVFGFMVDGFNTIGIVANLFAGVLYDVGAAFMQLKSKIAWGEAKEQAIADMDAMARKAQDYYQKASNGALEFKSKGIQAIEDINKTQEQKNAESVADAKATMDQLLSEQQREVEGKKSTEEEKLKAVQAYAEAAIAANKDAMDGVMQADLMTKGYIVTMNQAGKVSVEAWQKNADAATGTVNEADRARKAAVALGIDLDNVLNRVSEKFTTGKTNLDNFALGMEDLGLKGEAATNALYLGWSKWLETAKNQAEIDAAKIRLQDLGKTGQLSAKQVEIGLQAVKRAAQELPDSISPVEAAFERLGIKTKEQLKLSAELALNDFNTIMKSGEATQEGLQKAYEETIRLAHASGDAQVISAANAKAAYLGLEVQLDATGKATVAKLGEMQQAAVATQRTIQQVSNTSSSSSSVSSDEKSDDDDYWEKFKQKMSDRVAKSNEAAQARRSSIGGGVKAPIGTDSVLAAQQVIPDAPMVASSFDLTPLQDIQPTEKRILELQSGGKVAELQGTPEAVNSVEEMLQEFEMLKRSM